MTDVTALSPERLNRLLNGTGTMPTDEELLLPWVVDDLVHPELTVITGKPGAGKTTLLCSMLRSILGGVDWMGHNTSLAPDARVLFACEERTAIRRLRMLYPNACREHRLIPYLLHTWRETGLDRTILQSEGVGLVLIDNVFAAVGDANDQAEAVRFLDCVRNLGAPVIVVHHPARGGAAGPSGAQAYRAAYRHMIRVEPLGRRGPLSMRLTISGNDVAEEWQKDIQIDPDTVVPALLGPATADSAPKRGRQTRPGRQERASLLGGRLAGIGVDARDRTPGELATALIGPRRHEDAALCREVGQLIGSPGGSIKHQSLEDLIEQEYEHLLRANFVALETA